MLKSYDEKFLENIALRLKKLREKHNLTQENFIHDTGIHIGRIETGKRDLSATTLIKICKYFNISPQEFFSEGFDDFQIS